MKTKLSFHERQITQVTGMLTSQQFQPTIDFNELQKRCDELLHQARAEITQAFSTQKATSQVNDNLQAQISDMDKKFTDQINLLETLQKEDGQHKHMTVSMINIIDERVNGQDSRLIGLEKLTQEIHTTVQKHKNKSFEKIMTDKFELVTGENKIFQEQVRCKMLEIGNLIDQKCKKAVTTVYEVKLQKLENEIKDL